MISYSITSSREGSAFNITATGERRKQNLEEEKTESRLNQANLVEIGRLVALSFLKHDQAYFVETVGIIGLLVSLLLALPALVSSMSSKIILSIRRKIIPSFCTTSASKHNGMLHDDLNWYKSRHRIGTHKHHKRLPVHGTHPPAVSQRTGNDNDDAASATSFHAFDIVSFNLLAPVYKRLASKNSLTGHRHREAGEYTLWNARLSQTMDFFRQEIYKDTAIIALQEYWLDARYRQVFENQFHEHGYECRVMQRPGSKADAVALVVKCEVFEVRGTENINLSTFSDRVALLLWLRHRSTGFDLLVANTHLSFPHNVLDRMNQVAEMKHLTSVIEQYAHKHGIATAPALIMGDFNVEGHSPVCDHLRSYGYYSAFEVCPPVNTHHSGHSSSSEEGSSLSQSVKEKDTVEFVSVSTHETCVLPDPNSSSSSSAVGSSKRDVFECEDIGDDCVVDAPAAATAPALATPAAEVSVAAAGDGEGGARAEAEGGCIVSTATATTTVTSTVHTTATEQTTTETHTRTSVSYVSHFNHRDEQVGVDHIFLKPLPHKHPEDESHAWEVVPASPSTAATAADGGSSTSSNMDSSSREAAAPQLNIFIAECQVLPKSVACATWYPQFQISDHRPVRAKLIFTQQRNEGEEGKPHPRHLQQQEKKEEEEESQERGK